MATLASLVVSLEANVARFESDLNKAEFMAKKAMDTISNVSESAMGAVKGAVAAMAAAYTFDAFAEGIKGAVASAAEPDHMAKKTGATVEALSGLKSAAKLSGTGLEEVGGGLQKLSKAMFEAAGGSQKQSDLFKTLGIEVTDSSGKLRDSGEVMLDLAKKLDSMDSSTQAVATAQMLLGKRGAQLLPFMQDLADIGELNAKVTSEMAFEADAYEKNLVRLEGRKKSLYNTIAAALLPAMVDFTDALVSAGSMTTRLNEKAKELKDDNVIESWARNAMRAVTWKKSTDVAYVPFPGRAWADAGIPYQFRVDVEQSAEQGQIGSVIAQIDVPDKTIRLPNVAIVAGGARLAIGTGWKSVVIVNLTLQGDGGSATTARVLDKSTTGPLIQCFNASGAAAAGTVDAYVQGY